MNTEYFAVRYTVPSSEGLEPSCLDLTRFKIFIEEREGGLWSVIDRMGRLYNVKGELESRTETIHQNHDFGSHLRFSRKTAFRVAAIAARSQFEANKVYIDICQKGAKVLGRPEMSRTIAKVVSDIDFRIKALEENYPPADPRPCK